MLKYHPECKCFFENGSFDGMQQDWAKVCDALGQPIRVSAEEISYTKRNRPYGMNIDVPVDWREGLKPMDADACVDPARTVQTYLAYDKDCVRPLGASWTIGAGGLPIANTDTHLVVTAQTKDEAHT